MHGTNGGYRKHYRDGGRPCLACRIAYVEYRNDWRRARRRRAVLLEALAGFDKYPTGRRSAA